MDADPDGCGGAAQHSPDHALYAYAVDAQGSEVYEIRVKDLATGDILPGPAQSAEPKPPSPASVAASRPCAISARSRSAR